MCCHGREGQQACTPIQKQRKWWREGNKISFEIFACIKVIQKIAVKNASVALKINYSGF